METEQNNYTTFLAVKKTVNLTDSTRVTFTKPTFENTKKLLKALQTHLHVYASNTTNKERIRISTFKMLTQHKSRKNRLSLFVIPRKNNVGKSKCQKAFKDGVIRKMKRFGSRLRYIHTNRS